MRSLRFQFHPEQVRISTEEILADLHSMLASYLRALVLLSIATFIAFSTFFTLLGVPYVILLAGIAWANRSIRSSSSVWITAVCPAPSYSSSAPHNAIAMSSPLVA